MQIERLESRQLLASQGVLDTTFGANGRAQFELADNETIHAQAIGADGSVFVAVGTYGALRVIRFDATGTIDGSYGGEDGAAELPASIGDVKQMRALRFGKLMITGTGTADSSPATGPDMIAMRLGIRGVPDKSFGKDGVARVDLVSAEVGKPINDALHVSDISADGAVVLVSRMFFHNDTVGSEMGIALLRPDGKLESRFFNKGTYLSSAHRHIKPYPESTAGVEWSAVSFTNDGNAFDLFENTNLHSLDSGGNERMLIGDSQVHRFSLRDST